jgi:hypothetical protein
MLTIVQSDPRIKSRIKSGGSGPHPIRRHSPSKDGRLSTPHRATFPSKLGKVVRLPRSGGRIRSEQRIEQRSFAGEDAPTPGFRPKRGRKRGSGQKRVSELNSELTRRLSEFFRGLSEFCRGNSEPETRALPAGNLALGVDREVITQRVLGGVHHE